MAFVVQKDLPSYKNKERPASDWQTLTFNLAGSTISFDGCKAMGFEKVSNITENLMIGNAVVSTSYGAPTRTGTIEITQDMVDQIKNEAFKNYLSLPVGSFDYSLLNIAPFDLTIYRTVIDPATGDKSVSTTICKSCRFNKDSMMSSQGDSESWVKFEFKPVEVITGIMIKQ